MAELQQMKQVDTHDNNYYSCMDCEWNGDVSECDFDHDHDEFKGTELKYPICPKCGGGLDC